jgi:hypothetical protein
MSYKNYVLVQKHLFRSEYIFADTEEYLADQLFKNEKIRVNFGKEFGHKEKKYLLISCKIWNKDHDKFFTSMEKLRNKMPLIGNTDYEKFCKETFKMFD